CPHPPVKPNYTGLLRERFRYSSELRANRLPAGQIAVLSRTVLVRILRLDRRTGISAKEDLTAPPQTCRKDTFIGASFDAAGFVVNAADDQECLQTLRQIRADRDHWLKPVYLLQELSPAAASLSDGLVASAEQALAKLERFWQRGEALADLPVPQSDKERVLRYLFPRPDYLFEPFRDWRYPQLYHLPLLDVLLGSDAGQMNWLAKLHGRGLLEPVDFIDRVRACPQCADAHISFIDVCPSCQSIKISEQLFLHCHTCGNVAPQEHFLTTGALMCPKCYGALKHIGMDYDRALDNFSCEACRRIFTEPEIRARCHLCDWSGISEFVKKPTALGISRSGGARNPHVFQHTLRFLRSGGTRPPFARDGFFTTSQVAGPRAVNRRSMASASGSHSTESSVRNVLTSGSPSPQHQASDGATTSAGILGSARRCSTASALPRAWTASRSACRPSAASSAAPSTRLIFRRRSACPRQARAFARSAPDNAARGAVAVPSPSKGRLPRVVRWM
ncbi:MAG: hypothetical protein ACREYE_27690, partial [Gammaproteobacteria bacterium]